MRLGVLAVLVPLLLAGCGSDNAVDAPSGSPPPTETETVVPPTPAATGGGRLVFSADLFGDREVPGPGAQDGSGVAQLTFEGGRLCYELRATFGEQPTAAHIHSGDESSQGQVVLDLLPTFAMGEAAYEASACLPAGQPLVDQIEAEPGRFYVNVHSKAYPDGAIRGQLRAGPA